MPVSRPGRTSIAQKAIQARASRHGHGGDTSTDVCTGGFRAESDLPAYAWSQESARSEDPGRRTQQLQPVARRMLQASPVMTLAHWCILVAILSPYVFTAVAKLGGGFGPKANRDPRSYLAKLEGYRKRANNAQLNSFEAVPAFAAAVIVAHQVGVAEQGQIDALAVAFLVARAAYGAFYLADMATPRSLAWFTGLSCVIALFAISTGSF
jgi:uncharacterized MAPEG superfamily protein